MLLSIFFPLTITNISHFDTYCVLSIFYTVSLFQCPLHQHSHTIFFLELMLLSNSSMYVVSLVLQPSFDDVLSKTMYSIYCWKNKLHLFFKEILILIHFLCMVGWVMGGFQLLDLMIMELKSHMTC